ncbi:hypothetical protein ACFO5K_20980 [Nocardia halotolerans]|uniref:Integral membrane protein n=1 Tax=Nocardia halotolerans TaxID=1755878 RepID=A0ABV8VKI8_9NOCA
MTTPQLTSRLRGGGCGVLVGALAVAAHGFGGGGVPRSSEVALLLLVSLAAGAFAQGGAPGAVRQSRRGEPAVRAGAALVGGQWAGHFALSATLDHHAELLHLPSTPMVLAHLFAAFACAALILVAERLYLVASSVVRSVITTPSPVVATRPARWLSTVAVVRTARPKGARCPRAPPLFA